MTRLRAAWAWVSGDQGPLYDETRRAGEARIAHHLAMAEQADAMAEQERTIQIEALRSVSRYMRVGRDRAWDERDRARATAVALEQECARLAERLEHTAVHERPRSSCPGCHAVEATVAAAQVPS